MTAIGIAAAAAVISLSIIPTLAQPPADSTAAPAAAALKTPWGEPDLQGIWTYETDTPLQRLAKYAGQEFFTEAQRAELDRERAALLARDGRAERGTETDVTQGYNLVFLSVKRIGARTADRRPDQRPNSAPDAGSSEDCCRRSRISSRLVAGDRNVQEQPGGLQRREIRSNTVVATRRTSSPLQYRAHES
jgi:hypothetical protein